MIRDRSVVVTGIGLALPLGVTVEEVMTRAWSSASAIGPMRRLDVNGHACVASAEVAPVALGSTLRIPKNEKFMSHPVACGVRAAAAALAAARLDPSTLDPYRFGIYTGSGQTGLQPSEFFAALELAETGEEAGTYRKLGGRASRLVDRYWSLRTLANGGLGLLAAEWSARGACNNFVQGETASAHAVSAACFDILEGRSDAVLAGGYESLLTVSDYLAYEREGLLSPAPADRAYRPFDRERDGLVLGEGGAFLLLESAETARRRGAPVLAELLGAGFAQDGCRTGRPKDDPDAPLQAMREAADLQPDFLVAHGVGTPDADRAEAAGLASIGVAAPITAFKGLTGYLGAATAVTELALAILAARDRRVPPIARLASPDEGCELDLVIDRPRAIASATPTVMALSWSWSGQCAALAARALPA
jgi:3-oxoacyl-(acyl-carrier-protein) synthase